MARLTKLTVWQFKNHVYRTFDTNAKVVGFVGRNGTGKTNLLEAIYYLSFTKGYTKDADNICWQTQDGFRIEGSWAGEHHTDDVYILFTREGRKTVHMNDRPVRSSEYIGCFPAVTIAPQTMSLIDGGARERRKYLDGLLCQIDKEYLHALLTYAQVLNQKKSCLSNPAPHAQLIDIYNDQMESLCGHIHQKRKALFVPLYEQIHNTYLRIAGHADGFSARYDSQMTQTDFCVLRQKYFLREIELRKSLFGVHKDDIALFMNDTPFKISASQGQKKTLTISLKFAECVLLSAHNRKNFVLLLDDVFAKLDEDRLQRLTDMLNDFPQVQIFLTDTDKQRSEQYARKIAADNYKIYSLA